MNPNLFNIVPVLLAGGSGTRLWPLSRESHPKQFLRLGGEHTLLQQTLLRAAKLGAAAPIILGNEAHRFLIAEQLREVGIKDAAIVLEPAARNTAPAALVAALMARTRVGEQALIFLMAADHLIQNEAAFIAAARDATRLAEEGWWTTFGIKPTRPETGYGYLERGAPLGSLGFQVSRFVEKPDAARAQQFLDGHRHDWNGGLFLLSAAALIERARALEPAMLAACEAALAKSSRDLDFVRLDQASFEASRSESIDYAFMERAEKIALVPLDAGWDDVGAWSYLGKLPCDANGNRGEGDVIFENSERTLVHAASRLVATVGLRDTVVVETGDAVLVTTAEYAQDVKKIVQRLKAAHRKEAVEHARVSRPWGAYETIGLGTRFQVKRITVKPGQKLSLQMHHHRAEHWIVVSGTAIVTCGEKTLTLTENQSTYIPLGEKHRLENPGKIMLELIEVQSGGYLGEDDIVRFSDDYGRSAKG